MEGVKPHPVRVLMVTIYYPYPVAGGIEKQAHELARALQELGTVVLALGVRHAAGHLAEESVDGIPVLRLPWPQGKARRLLCTSFALFATLVRRSRHYDVVHVHVPSWFGLMSIVCAKVLGKRVLTKLPNIGTKGIPGMRARPFGWLAVGLLRCSDAIVAMSEESIKELREIGFPPSRILTTSNGISMPAVPLIRPSTEPKGGPVRGVFVGRLVSQKGLDTLLRAWHQLHNARDVDAVLELWGDGPQRTALEQLAEDLGIADRVVFRGQVEFAWEKLGTMDLFILPSFIEGNSNALLEAMVVGLPVVATRTGGTPMLLGAEGQPWLVDPGDAGALAERLGVLIYDRAVRQSLGRAMRASVEKNFYIRGVAGTYRRAYALLATGERERIMECKDSWPYMSE